MGREVRRVPKDWQHPTVAESRREGRYQRYVPRFKPLYDDYKGSLKTWETDPEVQVCDERPDPADYMPDWPASQRTHWQMYEDTSEGTPISPVFETPEELARWLADNGASTFGDRTGTYEQWLTTIRAGGALSAVSSPETGLVSGVEALHSAKGGK